MVTYWIFVFTAILWLFLTIHVVFERKDWVAVMHGLLTGTMDVGSLFADVREMPNDRCVYCAAEPPPSLYADHQIPRARGGPESGDNLVWACLSCNSRKHSRDPLEWFDLWAHSRRSRCCDGT